MHVVGSERWAFIDNAGVEPLEFHRFFSTSTAKPLEVIVLERDANRANGFLSFHGLGFGFGRWLSSTRNSSIASPSKSMMRLRRA